MSDSVLNSRASLPPVYNGREGAGKAARDGGERERGRVRERHREREGGGGTGMKWEGEGTGERRKGREA